MKVVCDSCSAKYQVPDERVVGKKLKIRCIRCSATVLIRGDLFESADKRSPLPVTPAPSSADEADWDSWYWSLDGDTKGPISLEELRTQLSSTTGGWDAHVWREGLADWIDARACVELNPNSLHVEVRYGADGLLSSRTTGAFSAGARLNVADPVLKRVREGKALREDVDSVGHELFKALCSHAEFASEYRRKLASASNSAPLRIVLTIAPDRDDSKKYSAADLFWEAMHDRQSCRHLGAALDIRLVRRVAGAAVTWKQSVTRPRLSIAFSSPRVTADGTPLLTLGQINEMQGFLEVEKSLGASSRLDAHMIYRLGIDNVSDELAKATLFHFSGHGEAGKLLLQSQDNRAQPLEGELLTQALASPPLLATLNCCRSGVGTGSEASLPIAFLRRGVACVVAMLGDLRDETALLFARHFYIRLAAGEDVETALQKTRWQLFAEQLHADWFLPSLWSGCTPVMALTASEAPADSVTVKLQVLESQAQALQPHVAILEHIHQLPRVVNLSDRRRREIVGTLAHELSVKPGNLNDSARELLADKERIRNIVRNPTTETSANASLSNTLSSLERTLLPRLEHVLSVLPVSVGASTPARAGARPQDRPVRGRPQGDRTLSLPDKVQSLEMLVKDVLDIVSVAEEPIRRCLVHLLAGRHLILIGPPGTGKSTIAQKLCSVFGYEAEFATANPDWTTHDVIGGIVPHAHQQDDGQVRVGYSVRDGYVTSAIQRNWTSVNGRWTRAELDKHKGTWLIIDEINRAPMDNAFGDLFTALISQELRVPAIGNGRDGTASRFLPIPSDFRLIGTANTADRHLLFEMSEALRRRFAFVEIPAYFTADRQIASGDIGRVVAQLSKRVQLQALNLPGLTDRLSEGLKLMNPALGRLRALHDMGIAQILDALCSSVVESRYRPAAAFAELLADALADQTVQALHSAPAEAMSLTASLLDGSLPAYLDTLLMKRLELNDEIIGTTRAHMVALRAYLADIADPRWSAFAEAVDDALHHRISWASVRGALPRDSEAMAGLSIAAPLAARLHKLAHDRD